MSQQPQARFDDLYSAVYTILDDAKATHQLVKLYKGSHGSDPHGSVLDVGKFFYGEQRGLLAWATEKIGRCTPDALDEFDATFQPRVHIRAAFDLLAGSMRRSEESEQDYLHYLTHRRHKLGAYRGGSSGCDDEARGFAAAYFQQLGLTDVSPDDVTVFCGGAKAVFLAFCAALMCTHVYDDLHHRGGLLLAPEGYYQSLRLIPPVYGGNITVIPDLTGAAVRDWLTATGGQPARVIYAPLVNNCDGRILNRTNAYAIARAVLTHNQEHPSNPAYVLGDDVYAGSYLTAEIQPQPIGAVTGCDLDDPSLGRMSDWTVSVITPSKTVALPVARVAFAATTSPRLRRALAHYRTAFSFGRVPQVDELTAAAALCLTPQDWIDTWNRRYRDRLHFLSGEIARINAEAGFEAFHIGHIAGGWYVPLRVNRRLFPASVASSVDAFSVFLHYGGSRPDTGIGLLPGALFGYRGTEAFTLRGTVAVDDATLHEFVARLGDLARVLRSNHAEEVVHQALNRARGVVDINAILAHLRF